jgi:hypothetical protein
MSDTLVPPPLPPLPPADRAQFWRDTITDCERSGRTVRDYCQAHQLSEKRFFDWRRKLGLGPAARPVASPASAAPGFVPVRVVPDTAAEVSLPGGVTVRVPIHADPTAVARLVAALAGGTR